MSENPKKKQTNAKINWGWDSPKNRKGKASRKTKSKAKKTIKKMGFKGILIVLLFLIIGGGAGFGLTYYFTKDDCFEINGSDEIVLCLGDVTADDWMYQDEGVKAISIGRDISANVIVETDLKKNSEGKYYATEVGTYFIKYKFDDIKYGKIFTVEKIRLITFVEAVDDDRVFENEGEGGAV